MTQGGSMYCPVDRGGCGKPLEWFATRRQLIDRVVFMVDHCCPVQVIARHCGLAEGEVENAYVDHLHEVSVAGYVARRSGRGCPYPRGTAERWFFENGFT